MYKKFLKSTLLAGCFMLSVGSLFGQTVTTNGIKYVLDEATMTASASLATTALIDARIDSVVNYEGSDYRVTSLTERAFCGCQDLKSVSLPGTIESIGTLAFLGCDQLNKVTTPSLESWLKIKFEDAFSNPLFYGQDLYLGGELLENLVLPEGLTEVGDYVFEGASIKSVVFPSSVISIGSHSFYQCEQLERLVTGSSMTTLGIQAFDGCTALEYIELSPSVETLKGYVFYDCKNLTKVKMGPGVKTVGKDAFVGCDALAEIEIVDLSSWCNIDFANEAANPLIKAHKLTMNGAPLTELTIPEDISEIKSSTFAGCTTIETVKGGKNLTAIGEKAFNGCKALKKVDLSGYITKIGEYAFESCGVLEECPLPEELKELGNYAFYGTALESVTIPSGITKLPNGVFGECDKLKNVRFTEGLTSINFGCFYGCSSLTQLLLPASLKTIGKSVFYGCKNLGVVKLGNSLESLGTFTFGSCPALKTIYVEAVEPPVLPENAFSNYDATLYVPQSSLSAYQSDETWGKFSDIQQISNAIGDITDSREEHVKVYRRDGSCVYSGKITDLKLPSGLYIFKTSTRTTKIYL